MVSLVSYINRTNQNISSNAKDHYLYFIQKYPALINQVSQKDMASYIGVSKYFTQPFKDFSILLEINILNKTK